MVFTYKQNFFPVFVIIFNFISPTHPPPTSSYKRFFSSFCNHFLLYIPPQLPPTKDFSSFCNHFLLYIPPQLPPTTHPIPSHQLIKKLKKYSMHLACSSPVPVEYSTFTKVLHLSVLHSLFGPLPGYSHSQGLDHDWYSSFALAWGVPA